MRNLSNIFPPFKFNADVSAHFRLVAGMLLLIGAGLRFYHLGDPSMWTDEMLVALNAKKSVSYLLSLSRDVEVHPPYFYFFYKFVMLFGTSDFWLRLPSAICGTLSLYFVWRAGERHIENHFASLAALGILTVHPLHIWISRQVRPYALIMMCTALSVDYLLRYLGDGRSRDAWRNLFSSLPIVTVHYLGFFVLYRRKSRLSSVALYGFGNVLCAIPSVYFLFEAKFKRHDIAIAADKGLIPALQKILTVLDGEFAFMAPYPYAWSILAGLTFLGALSLIIRRRTAAYLAFLAVIPPVMLVILEYSSHLYAVHLSFLLPSIVILAGVGLSRLTPSMLRRPWVILVSCIFLAVAFVEVHGDAFYSPNGCVATWWFIGNFKNVAKIIRSNLIKTNMIAFYDLDLYQSVNYYAEREGEHGVPSSQDIEPDGSTLLATFVTNYENFGHLFSNESEFKTLFGTSASMTHIDNIRFYQAAIARRPDVVMDGEHFIVQLTATPLDVYARAWTLKDLSVSPWFGCSLFPTKPRSNGEVTYRLTPTGGNLPQRFCLMVESLVMAPGNLLRVEFRFDDEDWKPLLVEDSQGEAEKLARFIREKPYRHLWLRVVLRSGEETATGYYGGLDQVRLNRLMLFADDPNARFGSSSLALREKGLGKIELWPGNTLMRRGHGPETVFEYDLAKSETIKARYRFINRIAGQSVEVIYSGRRVASYENLNAGQIADDTLALEHSAGPGRVEFRYSTWNHKNDSSTFAPEDPRDITVAFLNLSLEAPAHTGPPSTAQVLSR